VLRCGHTMHRDCLRALLSRAQLARCPLCAVSITESAATWAQMDADIARSVMPEEYRDLEVPCTRSHPSGSGLCLLSRSGRFYGVPCHLY
jgi:hypothetical protein